MEELIKRTNILRASKLLLEPASDDDEREERPDDSSLESSIPSRPLSPRWSVFDSDISELNGRPWFQTRLSIGDSDTEDSEEESSSQSTSLRFRALTFDQLERRDAALNLPNPSSEKKPLKHRRYSSWLQESSAPVVPALRCVVHSTYGQYYKDSASGKTTANISTVPSTSSANDDAMFYLL